MIFENIKELAKENDYFRKVIDTGPHSQLVLMSLLPHEDIGEEIHVASDQIFFIVDGKGEAVINGQTQPIQKKTVVFIPAGTTHNINNTSDEAMKLYTIYAPSVHADGTIHPTKADAAKENE